MATIFEHPGGKPRYYTYKDGDVHYVYEHGGGRGAVFYIRTDDNVVHDCTSRQPAFYIKDRWLQRYDGGPATLYFGEPIDSEPTPGDEHEGEA